MGSSPPPRMEEDRAMAADDWQSTRVTRERYWSMTMSEEWMGDFIGVVKMHGDERGIQGWEEAEERGRF